MIKLILNNNSQCETTLESTVKQVVWNMKNTPFIKIEGMDLKKKYKYIKVINENIKLFSGEVLVEDSKFSIKFDLESPLDKTDAIKVILDEEEYIFDIKLRKIYGTVRYINEKPVKNPIISCTNSNIISIGDEDGNFEILLSDKEESIGIFDHRYSKDMLETWIYNVDLDKDVKLDIHIDKCEVYGIRSFKQYCSYYMNFIPMSIDRVNYVENKGLKSEVEIAIDEDFSPKLRVEDVEVYCNNKKLEIVSFTEVKDFLGNIEGKNRYRNGYILAVPKSSIDDSLIKIKIKDNFLENEYTNVGIGEGYCFLNK
ncbi:hypothetical protein [Paraclostridium bifermentans]|uniref:hypothetical protein n=1 Tax=Paraclostridium bifermentans TaxID=1490 RepID=UPI00359CAC15